MRRTMVKFERIEKTSYENYCSSSLDKAQFGLDTLRDALIDYRNAGILGIRYDRALGYVDARLFLVLSKKGQANEAEQCLLKSLEEFQRDMKKYGTENGVAKREDVLCLIEKIDAGMNVKWKNLRGDKVDRQTINHIP